ncbi:Lrp/AsnC family transcriptional regulator [Staphylococcus shinii]|uniref:Lrp/AsnC family transcriptional regulator n=1 Tax=Staphylococcus shinii TaxID=2912228 RepID=UPI0008535592|nr:Lrp/AsnC family transcriptional regulator [Staphylococcus shinii]MBO3065828.1 Lrp/AsnC family transcriptional regulator [Staphylococcus shinii]OEK88034.1 AsnC family transcriptional regulator [Staphylococcus shinii]QRA16262.1 Lrp/AsnC family transcriptional regulator [Staphylococcus shinii]
MDLTDRKILKTLKEDSKVSLNYISNEVNLSTPSVRERINKLKDLGVINKYTIEIDYKTLGYDIEVIIDIVIKNNLYKDFKLYIAEQNNVEFCYRISGESCFIFKVRFKNIIDVERFVDSMQRYGHTKTHFIFSKTI